MAQDTAQRQTTRGGELLFSPFNCYFHYQILWNKEPTLRPFFAPHFFSSIQFQHASSSKSASVSFPEMQSNHEGHN